MPYPPTGGGGGFSSAGAGLTSMGSTVDVVGTAGNISVLADSIDLVATGVTPGNYNSATIDAYGRATAASLNTVPGGTGNFTQLTVNGIANAAASVIGVPGGGLRFGSVSSTAGLIWSAQVATPSGTNYALLASATDTFVNTTGIGLLVTDGSYAPLVWSVGGVAIQGGSSSGADTAIHAVNSLGASIFNARNDQKTGFGGVTSPTARVHVAAGQAVAGRGPFKFNDGPLTTVPEAGLEEFETNARYYTGIDGVRRRYAANSQVIVFAAFTVATLPVAPAQGSKAFVTDALAPTYLAGVVGGGAIVTEVFYNGTAWVCT